MGVRVGRKYTIPKSPHHKAFYLMANGDPDGSTIVARIVETKVIFSLELTYICNRLMDKIFLLKTPPRPL